MLKSYRDSAISKNIIVVTSVVFMGVFACKQKSSTNTNLKSLDNFAGGNEVHQCAGPNTDNNLYAPFIDASATSEHRAAINRALSALSPALKNKIFFIGDSQKHVEVHIKPVADLTSQCAGSKVANAYKNQKKKPFLSCHNFEDGLATIYTSTIPNEIDQGLVRALGYFVADYYSRFEVTKERILLHALEESTVLQQRDALAFAFLSDIIANKISLTVFAGMLSPEILASKNSAELVLAWIGSNSEDPNTLVDTAARKLFGSYVFAEAFDSIHCSNTSRSALKNFSRTETFIAGQLKPSATATQPNNPFELLSRIDNQSSPNGDFYKNSRPAPVYAAPSRAPTIMTSLQSTRLKADTAAKAVQNLSFDSSSGFVKSSEALTAPGLALSSPLDPVTGKSGAIPPNENEIDPMLGAMAPYNPQTQLGMIYGAIPPSNSLNPDSPGATPPQTTNEPEALQAFYSLLSQQFSSGFQSFTLPSVSAVRENVDNVDNSYAQGTQNTEGAATFSPGMLGD